jgi:hypothetical protein
VKIGGAREREQHLRAHVDPVTRVRVQQCEFTVGPKARPALFEPFDLGDGPLGKAAGGIAEHEVRGAAHGGRPELGPIAVRTQVRQGHFDPVHGGGWGGGGGVNTVVGGAVVVAGAGTVVGAGARAPPVGGGVTGFGSVGDGDPPGADTGALGAPSVPGETGEVGTPGTEGAPGLLGATYALPPGADDPPELPEGATPFGAVVVLTPAGGATGRPFWST